MNAFLSNEPACWASIVSTLAALAWPATSSVGRERPRPGPPWPSTPAGGCALLALAKPLTLPVTCVKAGSSSGATAGRRDRRLEQLVARQGAGAGAGAAAPPVIAGAGGAGARAAPGRLGAPWPRPCPSGLTGRHRLRRRHRLLRRHRSPARSRSWSRPAPTAAAGRPPGRPGCRPPWPPSAPSRPCRSPGSSLRISLMPASMSDRACSPGHFSLAAISAFTAALPASRCSASRARRPDDGASLAAAGLPPALGEGVADLGSRSVGRLACAAHGRGLRTPVGRACCGQACPGHGRCPNGHRHGSRMSVTPSTRPRGTVGDLEVQPRGNEWHDLGSTDLKLDDLPRIGSRGPDDATHLPSHDHAGARSSVSGSEVRRHSRRGPSDTVCPTPERSAARRNHVDIAIPAEYNAIVAG